MSTTTLTTIQTATHTPPTSTPHTPRTSQQILGNNEPPAITYGEMMPSALDPHTPTPSTRRRFHDPAQATSAALLSSGEVLIHRQLPQIPALQIPTPLRPRRFTIDSPSPFAPPTSQDPRDPLKTPPGGWIGGTRDKEARFRQRHRGHFGSPPRTPSPPPMPTGPPNPPPPSPPRNWSAHGGKPTMNGYPYDGRGCHSVT
jgi:hypothetical protein